MYLKNPIVYHFPEIIEAAFITCCSLHNWWHEQDGWDDWDEKGLLSEEYVAVEYDILDENNRCYGTRSQYHGFEGNFTRMQYRTTHSRAFYLDNDENNECTASEWDLFERRRMFLINHYFTMVDNHTLNRTL